MAVKKRHPTPDTTTTPSRFTFKQGQYLAFIDTYRKIHRRGPSEADIASYFHVTPPSVNQMMVKLEQLGLITRQAGVPRSAARGPTQR